MKKLLAILLVLCMVLAAAACGSKEAAAPAADTKTDAAPAAAETLKDKAAKVNRKDQFITVLTGPTSGIYYPIGGAFATALQNYGYTTSATATGATAENINAILTNQGELAVAMSDSVLQATGAWGAYEGKEKADLRFMMSLWPNYVQIVTTEDSGIKKFEDIKGHKVGVGAPNSGVELNARMIFEAYGMSYSDCQVDYLNYGEAIEQMKNGQCDVAFVTSGLGNATITELGVTKKIVFIPVEGDALKRLCEKYPCYFEGTIPGDTYGTGVDTTTAAVMNILLVSKSLPDEVVYDMLVGIFDQELATIQGSHKTAKANISLEQALRVVPIKVHPGAKAFYEDRGFTVNEPAS